MRRVASRSFAAAQDDSSGRLVRHQTVSEKPGFSGEPRVYRSGGCRSDWNGYRDRHTTRYSDRYLVDEALARKARRGVWAGQMLTPEAYRSGDGPVAPAGCKIKGNIGKRARIYHLPGQRDYGRTAIDPAKGEAWFCTVAGAETAGFRAALR